MTVQSSSAPSSESSWSWIRTIHYIGYGLLVAGGLAYWWLKPASLNPMADPRAAEAIALVQTHRAQGAPTILQALTEHVRAKKARGEGVYLGEWRVQRLEGDLYEVRVTMREQGQNQWFERELIWHANLATKRVNAASLPADGYMPADATPGAPMRSPFSPGDGQ
ncbi:MAG TPA: hypothetical protein VNK46_05760 [Nitrospiraceae bacterium]|nr:hypothetical protein [Nitrospiraceae bacterium]